MVSTWFAPLALIAFGSLVTALGFLIKRRLTGAPQQERVNLYASLTDLQAKMKDANVDFPDLDALAARLRGKVREAEISDAISEPDSYWTQVEMNARAFADYNVEEANLDKAMAELRGLTDNDPTLEAAHDAWLAYREQEAEFMASEYEGGSIQPLIRSTEAAALTRERRVRVEATIKDRRSR